MPWQKYIQGFLNLLYVKEERCTLCDRRSIAGQPVCNTCRQDIAALRNKYGTCRHCGRFISRGEICAECGSLLPLYQKALVVGPYEGMLKQQLQQFKYRGHRSMAAGFACLMAERYKREVRSHPVDVVVPVPLHWRKELRRNYNQSRLLARELAGCLGLPLAVGQLVKISDTPSQTRLTKEQRYENVAGSFRLGAAGAVRGRRIALVDDIITTGSTVSECAKVLKDGGAAEITVMAVASGLTPAATNGNFDILDAYSIEL